MEPVVGGGWSVACCWKLAVVMVSAFASAGRAVARSGGRVTFRGLGVVAPRRLGGGRLVVLVFAKTVGVAELVRLALGADGRENAPESARVRSL